MVMVVVVVVVVMVMEVGRKIRRIAATLESKGGRKVVAMVKAVVATGRLSMALEGMRARAEMGDPRKTMKRYGLE